MLPPSDRRYRGLTRSSMEKIARVVFGALSACLERAPPPTAAAPASETLRHVADGGRRALAALTGPGSSPVSLRCRGTTHRGASSASAAEHRQASPFVRGRRWRGRG